MPVLSLTEAEMLVANALEHCRTAPDNASLVARALVRAEAEGLKSHGLLRVPMYAAQAKAGKVNGFAAPSIEYPRPALMAVDARYGFAYPAMYAAVDELPDLAREFGIAAAGITRSHHVGVAGHVVEKLALQGLMAMMFANAPAAMAPWGGTRAVFGTDPLAFACPLPDAAAPIVVDLSLSKVARGHILTAIQKGESIPEGWALDIRGKPTTDAKAALAGTMVPLGDAKGTALALMVELLAAGLTGAHYATEASSFLDAMGPPPGTGQLIIAIDASAFHNALPRFAAMAQMIEEQEGARLPGARRLAARAKAVVEGIPVSDALLAEIRAL
jgi:(2R)-3-sulfolactate dehydrogenase (NADP+)